LAAAEEGWTLVPNKQAGNTASKGSIFQNHCAVLNARGLVTRLLTAGATRKNARNVAVITYYVPEKGNFMDYFRKMVEKAKF
jgi:hypothetical protein